ncbi:MAG: hypothetical protein AAF436_20285 [Myxococcota bacterium]
MRYNTPWIVLALLVGAVLSSGQTDCQQSYHRPRAAGWSQHIQSRGVKVIDTGEPDNDEPYLAVINFRSVFGRANSTEVEFVDVLRILPETAAGEERFVPNGIGHFRVGDTVAVANSQGDAPVPILGQFVLAMESDSVGWDPANFCIGWLYGLALPRGLGCVPPGVRDRMRWVRDCIEEQLEDLVEGGRWNGGPTGLAALEELAQAVQNQADNSVCAVPSSNSAAFVPKIDQDDRIGVAASVLLGIEEEDFQNLGLRCDPQSRPSNEGSTYISVCYFGTRDVTFPLVGSGARWELTTRFWEARTPYYLYFAQPRWTVGITPWSLVPWRSSEGIPYRQEVHSGELGITVEDAYQGKALTFPGLSNAESMGWYASPRYGPLGADQKILSASGDTVKVNHFTGEYDTVLGTSGGCDAYARLDRPEGGTYTPRGNNPAAGGVITAQNLTDKDYLVHFVGADILNVLIHAQEENVTCSLTGVDNLHNGLVPITCTRPTELFVTAYVSGSVGCKKQQQPYAYFDRPTVSFQTADSDFSRDPLSDRPVAWRVFDGGYAVSRSGFRPLRIAPLVTTVGPDPVKCYVIYIDNVGCGQYDDGDSCFVVRCAEDSEFMVRWVMSENPVY